MFYSIQDWVQFEEIGDLEERAYSQFFETMMSTNQMNTGTNNSQGSEVISCPVAKGDNDDVSSEGHLTNPTNLLEKLKS